MRLFLSLLLSLLLFDVAYSEAIYKWVDEKGKVHFSSKPRAGAEVVQSKPVNVSDGVVRSRARPMPRRKPAKVTESRKAKAASSNRYNEVETAVPMRTI